MKKWLSWLLVFIMLVSSASPSFAASKEAIDAADQLYEKGLFSGAGTLPDGTPNYDLDRAPKRTEAIVMLLGLLGKSQEAMAGTWNTPFTDVPSWAKPFVGYAYTNNLTYGISETQFGANNTVTAAQYLTFVLLALGYESGKDFVWNKASEFSDSIGLTHGEYTDMKGKTFTRGDVVLISNNALSMKEKGKSTTLLDRLIADGVVNGEQGSDATGLTLQNLLAEVTAKRREETSNAANFSEMEQYLIDDPEAYSLLTDAEIETLQTERRRKSSVSSADAISDIELLFRAYREAYAAYYYFGEENFKRAEENLISWLQTKNTVNVEELINQLYRELSFVRDAHFKFVSVRRNDTNIRYEYYYITGLTFHKDQKGYYTELNNAVWYFDCFSDSRVSMEKTLTEDGELAYSPVLFCPSPEKTDSKMTLKDESGNTKDITLKWTLSESYSKEPYRVPDYKCVQENGLAYVSLRSFENEYESTILTEFAKSGTALKGAKAIVFDIRSNGGGGDATAHEWLYNFSSKWPSYPLLFAKRISPLMRKWENTSHGNGWDKHIQNGGQISNQIPIIVLVDDKCGSSGESMLNNLKNLDNVLVIGGNSSGFQLIGNAYPYYLPNTGIGCEIGCIFHAYRNLENVDYKGYEPDVWCNPKTCLDSVWNMLIKSGIATEDDVKALKKQL